MTVKTASLSRVQYVEVAPSIPLPSTSPQTYTYSAHEQPDIALRTRVIVPFGPRSVVGVVMARHRRAVPYRTKSVTSSLPFQLTPQQVAFATWLSTTMHGSLGYTLRLFFPPARRAPRATTVAPAPSTLRATAKDTVVLRQVAAHSCAYIEADRRRRTKKIVSLARAVAAAQRQLLVLVPEKWMVDPLLAALKDAGIAAAGLHADLPARAQTACWLGCQRNTIAVVVGTQKALFLPYHRLAGIVIEEEFLASHKLWDQYPRLHNVYGAQHLAQLHGCQVFYSTSSASPALWHAIAEKRVISLQKAPLQPRVRVIAPTPEDLTTHRLLPDLLVKDIRSWLRHNQTVLILHNARGAWRAAICRNCHTAARCKMCGAAMIVPSTSQKTLRCPACGVHSSLSQPCSGCGKKKLFPIGLGLDKLSEVLRQTIPAVTRVVQADAASFRRSGFAERVSSAQVVLATSAIFSHAPQLRFDHAIYAFPERGLLYPDFRSTERTYALLLRLQQQVRGVGKVTLFTRRPRLVHDILAISPEKFATMQLRERKALGYPPYRDAVLLTIESTSEANANKKAAGVRTEIETRLAQQPTWRVQVRGPFMSFGKKRRDHAAAHLLLLGDLEQLRPLYQGVAVATVDVAPERIL